MRVLQQQSPSRAIFHRAASTEGPKGAPEEVAESVPQGQLQDSVDISAPAEEPKAEAPTAEPKPGKKRVRPFKKAFLNLGGFVAATYDTICSIPESFSIAHNTLKGEDTQRIKDNAAKWYIGAHTAMGAAVGSFLGPFGMVCGAVAGFMVGAVSNTLESRSSQLDNQIERVKAKLTPEGEPKMGQFKGLVTGAWDGITNNFKESRVGTRILLAGVVDGFETRLKDTGAEPKKSLSQRVARNGIEKALEVTVGTICGLTGVLINAPGGAVLGALHNMQDENRVPTPLEKILMLMGTNLGKAIPGTAVAALLGGGVGLAAGTAVTILTGSLTSVIDGRYGFHRGITRKIKDSIATAHGEEEAKNNLRAYYQSGKGLAVGLSEGIKQGWELGYEGGVEILHDILATPAEIHKAEDEKP